MVARLLAEQRHATNRQAQVTNRRIGPQSDAETDLNGIGGELAFCLLANCCPDLSVSPRRGGWDCTTQRGSRVDVKTSRYEDAQLVATIGKRLTDADVYVLMVGTFPVYRLAGWCTAAQLLRTENVTDLGYGPTYALSQAQLSAWVQSSLTGHERIPAGYSSRPVARVLSGEIEL